MHQLQIEEERERAPAESKCMTVHLRGKCMDQDSQYLAPEETTTTRVDPGTEADTWIAIYNIKASISSLGGYNVAALYNSQSKEIFHLNYKYRHLMAFADIKCLGNEGTV